MSEKDSLLRKNWSPELLPATEEFTQDHTTGASGGPLETLDWTMFHGECTIRIAESGSVGWDV